MNNKFILKEKNFMVELFFFLDQPTQSQEVFLANLLEKIPFDQKIGYSGYKDQESLKQFLLWFIYGKKSLPLWSPVFLEACTKEIKEVFTRCHEVIQDTTLKIFIYPTLDPFVVKKMQGVVGFTPWKNTILLGVYNTPNFGKALQQTVCHELAHALSSQQRATLGDDLIAEGLAEHFKETFIDKNHSPWVTSLSQEEIKKILKEIQSSLKDQNNLLYQELFFGTGKYPLWSGYAIGYYLVEKYL